MASPHRSESFFQDGPASPSILLVPTGDGDSFKVVLGPVLTLVRSEEASLEPSYARHFLPGLPARS
jgi:hypothetical protein